MDTSKWILSEKQCLSFLKEQEHIFVDDERFEYPMGELLFSVLDIGWLSLWKHGQELLDEYYLLPNQEKRTIKEGIKAENEDKAVYSLIAEYYQNLILALKDYPAALLLFSPQAVTTTKKEYEAIFDIYSVAAENFRKAFRSGSKTESDKMSNRISTANIYGEDYVVSKFLKKYVAYYPDFPESYRDDLETFSDFSDERITRISLYLMENTVRSLKNLSDFNTDLLDILEKTLDIGGSYNDMSYNQRFHLLASSRANSYARYQRMGGNLHTSSFYLKDNEFPLKTTLSNNVEAIREIKSSSIEKVECYSSNNLCHLVMKELEVIGERKLFVRRCAHCDKYFLPKPSTAVYCDRIFDKIRSKTCKELYGRSIRKQETNMSKAKKSYTRNANAYRMRTERSPECYPRDEYDNWRENAKELLRQYGEGEIIFDDFESLIEIPPIK